ncbi:hypothetical protein ACJ41O_003534 [Fusarium nematophilum]
MPAATDTQTLDDFLRDPRFNRQFTLPADPSENRPSLKVKYADYGYRNESNPEEENVLLFCPPLMASRMLHVAKDGLAKRHRVRIVSLDRPGFGGADDVEVGKRLAICREITLALLRHLEIQYVSLACHSGGTVYALDMLLHHPEVLHPERGYIAIAAPWIMPSHSRLLSMAITQALPNGLLAQADKLASFLNNTLSPALSTDREVEESDSEESDEDVALEKALSTRLFKYISSEGIRGMPSEAILLMQKVKGPDGWGDWGDYDKLVPKLAVALERAGRRLSMDVFFAETDSMVGDAETKGPKWFEQCWDGEVTGEAITYNSTIIDDSEHETIWQIDLGVPGQVFEKIGEQEGEATE